MSRFKSFLRRISQGGVLAVGVAMLLSAGCELAYDDGYDDSAADVQAAEAVPLSADKLLVCHFPPGNSLERYHTISITESALADHLSHGDLIGDCDEVVCDGYFCAGS